MSESILTLLAILIVIGRFFVPGHDLSWPGTYESFAHIVVGVLIGAVWFSKPQRWTALILLIFSTILEVVMFMQRHR